MRDPKFFEPLREAVIKNQDPVPELPKTLTRRKLPDYFRFGRKASLYLHLGVLLVSVLHLTYNRYFRVDSLDNDRKLSPIEQQSAIRVEVLDLPTKKLSDLRNIDLRKKVGDAGKKESTKAPADAMVMKRRKAALAKLNREEKKLSALARLKDNREEMEIDQRAALAGNRLSQGYSLTGDVATDKEVHSGKIKNHLLKFWNVPAWMAASKSYRAQIVVKLGPNGSVLSKEMIKKSGNEEFDAKAMEAISAADPFPAPPDSLKRLYMEEGILCAFPE